MNDVILQVIFNNLMQHKAVYLPHIGALTVVRMPAIMNEKGEIVKAPTQVVLYNPQHSGQPTIAELMVDEHGCAASEAQAGYEQWLQSILKREDDKEIYCIGGIGVVEKSPSGESFCVSAQLDQQMNPVTLAAEKPPVTQPPAMPQSQEPLLPAMGLDVKTEELVVLPEISEPEPEPEKEAEPEQIREPEAQPVSQPLPVAPVVTEPVAAPQPVQLPPVPVATADVEEETIAPLLPQEGFRDEPSRPDTSLEEVRQRERTWKSLAWIFIGGFLLSLIAFAYFHIVRPKEQPEKRVIEVVRDTVYVSESGSTAAFSTGGETSGQPAAIAGNQGFHIIGGAFLEEANANKMIARFEKKGIKARQFYSSRKQLYMVSIGQYATEAEALAAMRRLPEPDDAWDYNNDYWIYQVR